MGKNIGKSKREYIRAYMLKYQGGFFALGYCGLSLLGFDFFSPIPVLPCITKRYELSGLLFLFPPSPVLLPPKRFSPVLYLLLCFCLTVFLHSIASGPAQGSPRAQQNRGYDFSFNASSSARSSNCSKMNPALMTQLQAKAC